MADSRPQPYYDHEIARICEWLRARRLSMHVTLRGEVSFRPVMKKLKPGEVLIDDPAAPHRIPE